MSTKTKPTSSKTHDTLQVPYSCAHFVHPTDLMRLIQTFSFLLSLHSVAVQQVAARFASSILYPNASSIWYRDYTHNVTWCVFQICGGES